MRNKANNLYKIGLKLTEHRGKSGSEVDKLIDEFNAGLGNGMSKPDLKSLWERICQMLPSVTGLSNAGDEFFKLF